MQACRRQALPAVAVAGEIRPKHKARSTLEFLCRGMVPQCSEEVCTCRDGWDSIAIVCMPGFGEMSNQIPAASTASFYLHSLGAYQGWQSSGPQLLQATAFTGSVRRGRGAIPCHGVVLSRLRRRGGTDEWDECHCSHTSVSETAVSGERGCSHCSRVQL
ncbi:hypothetical protein P153DRAFT_362302 [Dothidotthia symphoricarpi CBS 119687]|uniref:Uncharacterized protein n=1 Tax=Dothidotthia symphoricarpi CBS 119687 TaxID=1392245 RepID=A0A6A6ARC5_9PLEO|nr:uncharacterized protein P153DRAFT_362302 [Dothidotthia symphoricarpi CBS 119687]KAF2134542.1 hypothetical protein P153DRAFT_362302 [Dothidotthia symphoricarpi CBS 119687]